MEDKKITLNNDQLEHVVGGSSDNSENDCRYLPATHGAYVTKYEVEGLIGQKVYVVDHGDISKWLLCEVRRSWEEITYRGLFDNYTTRKHNMYVIENHGFVNWSTGVTYDFNGDSYTIYKYN